GVYSAPHERLAQQAGVQRIVLPATGKPSADRRRQERSGWGGRGVRFRGGVEGGVSGLRRRLRLGRVRGRGAGGPGRRGGWGGRGGVGQKGGKIAETVAQRGPAPTAQAAA